MFTIKTRLVFLLFIPKNQRVHSPHTNTAQHNRNPHPCYTWTLALSSLEQFQKQKISEEEEEMQQRVLDYVLVPAGLLVMVAYHLWLLYRILAQPNSTVIGINSINRRFWVHAMMEEAPKHGVLAVQTLRNNIMASTLLASTAITLCSLIALLMTSGTKYRAALFVFGDRSELAFAIKFFAILVCFLVAFLFNVQSIRYYSHASILINAPCKRMSPHHQHHNLNTDYVATTVNRGSYFWSLGLRAFYFSFPLFLWIFGPIPMFVSCFVLVIMLYFLDVTFQFGWDVGVADNDDHILIKDDEEQRLSN